MLEGQGFFAEMKRPGRKVDGHQVRELDILGWAGFEVYVLDTFEKINEVLSEAGRQTIK